METFEHLLYQLHLSYLHARKNKRNSQNQLNFELDQEANLHQLAESIYNRSYSPKPSIAFIIQKPVMREIFAADFSDRVIHHLIYRCIFPIIDRKLIHDTYSCRVGKGTLYGINRAKAFIRSCSHSFSKETFYLKVDIEAYFMNMQHDMLYDKVAEMLPPIKASFLGISRNTLLYLIRKTIFNPVTQNCRIKGDRRDWVGLPPSKSLFTYPENVGLPIGNLTSQVFGNVYLNDFDHYVKKMLNVKYYGRYVDDMLFINNDKNYMKSLIPKLELKVNAEGLRLHPNKIVLKEISEGISFLGHYIKPYRSYISNRTKKNVYLAVQRINKILSTEPQLSWEMLCKIRSTLNSYLGILKHAQTFNFRKSLISKLKNRFFEFFFVDKDYHQVIINEEFWQWHFSPNYRFTN